MNYRTRLAQLRATAQDLLDKGGLASSDRPACCTVSCACCSAWTKASVQLAADLTANTVKTLEALRVILAAEASGTQLQKTSALRTARELLENIDKETD